MLKTLANSKLFFIALGITVALCGMQAFAGPPQFNSNDGATLGRIANSLDKIQRDGIKLNRGEDVRVYIVNK